MTINLPPQKSYWLQSDKVYQVVSVSRATDEVILKDLDTTELFKERFATFHFVFKRVFKVGTVGSLLNRTPRSLHRYEANGIIDKQKMYRTGGGKLVRFYTKDDIEKIQQMISLVHQGRMGSKGRIINNSVPDIGNLKIEMRKRFK